jgi:ankyrin repeat protein
MVNDILDQGADIEQSMEDGKTGLMLAAASGHESVVKLLLDRGAKLDERSWDRKTVLMLAAASGHESVVKLLLDRRAKLDERNWGNGETALMLAAANGHESVVKLLLDSGAKPDESSWKDGETALIAAATKGHKPEVRLLLEDSDIQGDKKATASALIAAATEGQEPVVRLLLKDSNIQGDKKARASALIAAATEGYEPVVRLLLEDSDIQGDKKATATALITAATEGHEHVVRLLLEGPSIRYRGEKGRASALIAAATEGHELVVRLLLEDPNIYYKSKKARASALIAAATGGHELVVRLLLEDPSILYRGEKGRASALIAAATEGHEPVVRLLLKHSELRDVADKAVASAIIAATNFGQESVLRLLLGRDLGIDIIGRGVLNAIDNSGRTALHIAAHRGDERAVGLLLEAGADVATLDDAGLSPLSEAALSGGTPIDLNSLDPKSFVDQPAAASTFLLLKLELGLRTPLGNFQASQQSLDIEKCFQSSEALYDFCIQATAKTLESSNFLLETLVTLSDEPFTSQIPAWGESLLGAYIRLTLRSDFSVVLRLDKFLGFGSQEVGSSFIQALIQLERKHDGTRNWFRLSSFLKASSTNSARLRSQQMLTWMLALTHSICGNEARRARTICQKKQDQPKFGSCWRDAFGDIFEFDLSGSTALETLSTDFQLGASLQQKQSDGYANEFSNLVLSSLEDLATALGIHSQAVLDGIILMQGLYGVCVLIGFLSHPPIALWHVCSIEEASLLSANPQGFVRLVKECRNTLSCAESQGSPHQGFSARNPLEGIVLVGALVNPAWCATIDSNGLFQAPSSNTVSGRTQIDTIGTGLRWERITGQAQFSMGAQGPQGTLSIGGEASRGQALELLTAEASLSTNITILERALRSWVIVYQASNGQFAEQNLYCLTHCLLKVGHVHFVRVRIAYRYGRVHKAHGTLQWISIRISLLPLNGT